jgi:lysophospholipase L1-like esterase
MWETMKKTNLKIKAYSDKDDTLHYVDLATPMINKEGTPNSSLFVSDGLHLNEKGYELWTGILLPVLEEVFQGK